MIENHLNCEDLSDWIEENVENMSFNGMDYPYDLVDCCECYYADFIIGFKRNSEISACKLGKLHIQIGKPTRFQR